MSYTDKKVSFSRSIAILAKNDIEVEDDQAAVIVDFLYLRVKNYKKPGKKRSFEN